MPILGISAYYHDSAAALLSNGKLVAAAQEERFTRKKHDPGFPSQAVQYCLSEAGISPEEVAHVVFYDKPILKFERLLETYLSFAPAGFRSFATAMPVWAGEKFFQRRMIARELGRQFPGVSWSERLLFSEHHFSHAASAYFPSPFKEAAVLTMDGVGEWATTSLAMGRGNELHILKEIHFPHSLGLLYSAFTYFTGFKVNSGEYKLMGLAPYGEPKYQSLIRDQLIDVKEDGTFRLDMQYFDYCTGLTMTNERFDALFGVRPRKPEEPLTQLHMDLAASVQAVTEDIVLRMARSIRRETGLRQLCLAGGVALNCVANGKLVQDGQFDSIWIQPAAGDAGGAVGAAYAVWHHHLRHDRPLNESNSAGKSARDGMQGSYLGPGYEQADIEQRLSRCGARFSVLTDEGLLESVAGELANGKAVGWFQGRMEFGPRALGGRSILGDPRSQTMQRLLNLKVKYRESFRPFAPAILREDLTDWFELDSDSPYMLMVAPVKQSLRRQMTEDEERLFGIEKLNVARSSIPAVTHVDYSARIQTVHADTNPHFYGLLQKFKERTGCPVLVNTSFNVRGEPIVCTPEDAFRCFMGTEIELLAIGNCLLRKEEQDASLKLDYKSAFELD